MDEINLGEREREKERRGEESEGVKERARERYCIFESIPQINHVMIKKRQ